MAEGFRVEGWLLGFINFECSISPGLVLLLG